MIFILIISSAERRYPGLHNPGYQTPTEEVRVHDVHFDNITFMGNKCETGRICGLLQNWQMTFMSMVSEHADR